MRKDDWVESSRGIGGQQVWKKIWQLHVPNKIEVFKWRACQDILPTRANLVRRKIISDNGCQCCIGLPEFALHAIQEYGVAQDLWAGSSISLQKCINAHHDIFLLFESLLDRLLIAKFELFLVQAWLIWNQRNAIVHGGQIKDPKWLNKRAVDYLEEYRKAQEQLTLPSRTQPRNTSQPPPPLMYKLNFDAAIFAELQCSGFRAIIRNSDGEVMAAMPVKGPSVNSSEEAEALACRKAIEFSMEAGFSEVLIEGDNTTVMKAVSSSSGNHSLLGHIWIRTSNAIFMGYNQFQ